MKTCRWCGRSLPEDAFYPRRNKCRDCQIEYLRRYYRENYIPVKRRIAYQKSKWKHVVSLSQRSSV